MAVVIGMDGRPATLLEEFDLADADRATVDDLINRLTIALDAADTHQRNLILAALAELSARYIEASRAEDADLPERATS